MILKYDIEINNVAIIEELNRLTNQIFKLLPCREENGEWKNTLENIIIEFKGMNDLMMQQTLIFSLLCKLEGLFSLEGEDDFLKFRKNIFECLSIIKRLKECLD